MAKTTKKATKKEAPKETGATPKPKGRTPDPAKVALREAAAKLQEEKRQQRLADKKSKEIAPIKSGALSVDVGPIVLETLTRESKEEEKHRSALMAVEQRTNAALSMLTNATIKAAMADPSIDLNSGFRKGTPYNKLSTQIQVALGIKEFFELKSGSQGIRYTAAAKKFFPAPTDKKNSPEYRRKATFASNFAHSLKKCIGAAAGALDLNAKPVIDAETQTLRISGPGVKEHFGTETVTLDGKNREGMTKGMKGSFTELQRVAAAKRDVAVTTRKDSRTEVVTTEAALVNLCKSLTDALAKISGTPSEKVVAALESVQNAVEHVLNA